VCRSVGEELTDNSSVDPTGNPLFLGTIRESNISSGGNSAGDNHRTVCQAFIFIYSFSAFINFVVVDFPLTFCQSYDMKCSYISLYIATEYVSLLNSIKSLHFHVTVLIYYKVLYW
jgi:hypothetical protein